jgi:hypothetical protein
VQVSTSYVTSVVIILSCSWKFKDTHDRLCGLVARVPYYRPRSSGFDSRRYQLLSCSDLENRDDWPCGPVALTTRHHSISKVGTKIHLPAAVAQSELLAVRTKSHGVRLFVLFFFCLHAERSCGICIIGSSCVG